jgi:hypothetical protein
MRQIVFGVFYMERKTDRGIQTSLKYSVMKNYVFCPEICSVWNSHLLSTFYHCFFLFFYSILLFLPFFVWSSQAQ